MKVTQCCCGCSLRTGSLILFWLVTIGGILELLQAFAAGRNILGCIIPIAVGICGIIGTEQKNPVLLIPYIAVNTIALISIGLLMLLALFAWGTIASIINSGSPSGSDQDKEKIETGAFIIVASVELCLAVVGALTYYFIIVVYSFYCQLREQVEGLIP